MSRSTISTFQLFAIGKPGYLDPAYASILKRLLKARFRHHLVVVHLPIAPIKPTPILNFSFLDTIIVGTALMLLLRLLVLCHYYYVATINRF